MRRIQDSLFALSLVAATSMGACDDGTAADQAPALGSPSDGKGDRASSPPAYQTVGDLPLSDAANAK